jgi:hypothetical protein
MQMAAMHAAQIDTSALPLVHPYAPGAVMRRPELGHCVLDLNNEIIADELGLEETAVTVIVIGNRADFWPKRVLEAILNDFPEILLQAINCSLYINDTFLVRCSERRWRDLRVGRAVVLDNGTPLQLRPWSRLFMTEQVTPRYRVRLFVEGLPSQAFTVETARKVLPSYLFHTVAVSSTDKTDLSYFVVYAWVHDPDTIHKVVAIDLPVFNRGGCRAA